MPIVEILAPLILLIALGAGLAHIKFLGEAFMADLNKLAFWIALPALLFSSASVAGEPGHQTWLLLGVVFAGTILIAGIAWGVSLLLGMPLVVRGTLMQSAFRGNLLYIGVPVLIYSFGDAPEARQAIATAVIVGILTMALYNVLAVIVLQTSQHVPGSASLMKVVRSIAKNPLLIAGLLGLIVPLLNIQLPTFLSKALDSLGSAAVPIALLCIGGSLATISLKGKRSWIIAAVVLKIMVLPLFVFFASRWVGLESAEQRIALVLTSCPTAAAAFVMAREMGGDTALASGSIALSTLLSAASLAAALWLTM